VLFGLRILKTVLSIAVLSLSAHYFGISIERDIWILAFNSILVLDLALWGPINETFRTKFIFLKQEHGEASALQKTSSLLIGTSIITIIVAAAIIFFPQIPARIIAPGYYHTHLPVLELMIRIIAPSFLLNQVIQLIIGVLNAYHSFYLPEIAGVISAFLNVIVLVILAPVYGIYSLVVSYYLGLIILFVLVMYQVRKLKLPFTSQFIKMFSFKDIRPFVLYALPFFLPYFAGQVNLIAEKSIANLIGSGTVSIVDYSRKFTDIPVNVLSSVLLTMLLPVLSGCFTTKENQKFVQEFKRILQFGLLILTIVIGTLILNATDIVSILYGNSKIPLADINILARLVQLYSFSGYSIFLYVICGIALIASAKGKFYALFGVLAQILMLGVNFLFYRQLNVFVFPASLFLSHFISSFFLYSQLPFGRSATLKTVWRYSILLVMVVVISYIAKQFFPVFGSPYFSILVNTSMLLGIAGLFVYLLQFEERRIITSFFRRLNPVPL
jgi:putative peptidoglycan lipid II flippase